MEFENFVLFPVLSFLLFVDRLHSSNGAVALFFNSPDYDGNPTDLDSSGDNHDRLIGL